MHIITLIAAAISLAAGFASGYALGGDRAHTLPDTPSAQHAAMVGMTAGLTEKTGDELDAAFLDEMIVHHEGAIEMAKILRAETNRPELQDLAERIIETQSAEIEQMRTWRDQWFGQQ